MTITGGGGSGAKATAFIKNGKVTRIRVDNEGSGYIQITVNLAGSTTGTFAHCKCCTR